MSPISIWWSSPSWNYRRTQPLWHPQISIQAKYVSFVSFPFSSYWDRDTATLSEGGAYWDSVKCGEATIKNGSFGGPFEEAPVFDTATRLSPQICMLVSALGICVDAGSVNDAFSCSSSQSLVGYFYSSLRNGVRRIEFIQAWIATTWLLPFYLHCRRGLWFGGCNRLRRGLGEWCRLIRFGSCGWEWRLNVGLLLRHVASSYSY